MNKGQPQRKRQNPQQVLLWQPKHMAYQTHPPQGELFRKFPSLNQSRFIPELNHQSVLLKQTATNQRLEQLNHQSHLFYRMRLKFLGKRVLYQQQMMRKSFALEKKAPMSGKMRGQMNN